MNEEAYVNVAANAVNQPLGGKEIRFPSSGQSSVVEASRIGSSYTPCSVNVILRAPYNEDSCGGTRPGLKAFVGTQPVRNAISRWLWPNGETILWPNDDKIAFSNLSAKVVMPDGGVMCEQHASFDVNASKGAIPGGVSIVTMYRDRVVVAKDAMWYASRLGVPDDFDYGGDGDDVARAVAGNVALAGREGENVTAVIPVLDSFLYVATARSLWRATGEITGGVVTVSDSIGIVSRDAWCFDGMRLWFLGTQGLYSIVAGEPPVLMTPHLDDVLSGWSSAVLVYDAERLGIHVIGQDANNAASDWCYDIRNKAMWRMKYPVAIRPLSGGTAMLDKKNRVVFVCADGAFRYWDESQATDDGTEITSAVVLGPIAHTTGATENGFLAELDCDLDVDVTTNGGANLSGVVGKTAIETIASARTFVQWIEGGASSTSAEEKFRYAQTKGWNKVVRPRLRCNTFALVVWSTAARWAISRVTAAHRGCGRIRG